MALQEFSYNPSCGNFVVSVKRKQSHFTDSASIGVHYDEYVDSDHTVHRAFMPWHGGRVSATDVEELLKTANVPAYVTDVSAGKMILRCVEEIINDKKQKLGLSSVLAIISTDQETGIFSDDDDDEDESD